MTWAFILDHYNYWIVIILMMAGLYVVLDRGNLVKKLVGLNVFQTSVFLLYISMGKILGGTAPIEVGGHGDGHGEDHSEDHAEAHDAAHGTEHSADAGHGDSAQAAASAHDTPDTDHADSGSEATPEIVSGSEASDSSHVIHVPDADPAAATTSVAEGAQTAATDTAHSAVDQVGPVHDVIYSNPLPHVLILTAIVVGVATLAVGLAIIVRIRESYGTIEEDEIVAADHAAEFGEAARRS